MPKKMNTGAKHAVSSCGCPVAVAHDTAPTVRHWVDGLVETAAGKLPRIKTTLMFRDRLGGLRIRLGVGRERYRVTPGLYAVNHPTAMSPVLVTANYKYTLDRLRRHLSGIDAWLLVLDTRGINVWCAAGKGTFGTEELLTRIKSSGLEKVIRHRRLILPQLSATGVSGHEISRRSGFHVVWGPIRAVDLPRFLSGGMKADPAMRRVTFNLGDRLALTSVEIVQSWKLLLPILIFLFFLEIVFRHRFSVRPLLNFLPFLGAVLTGCLLVPLLLPWIPGRSFAWKGWLLGLVGTLVYVLAGGFGWRGGLVYLLLLPAIASFMSLNFTGSTTFTSLSGVIKEMRFALPLLILSAVLGVVLAFVW